MAKSRPYSVMLLVGAFAKIGPGLKRQRADVVCVEHKPAAPFTATLAIAPANSACVEREAVAEEADGEGVGYALLAAV